MITLSAIFTITGLLFCYNTSDRALIARSLKVQHWSYSNKPKSNVLGIVLMIIGLVLCMYTLGTGAGIFSFLIILMTALSLIIMLGPLKILGMKSLIILLLVTFIVEIFIF